MRLDKLYPEPTFLSPLPCPRRTLRFPVETSWGSGRRWPAEFADDRVVSTKVLQEMEDSGATMQQAVEAVGTDGVSAAARMAQLNGEEPARPLRQRRASQRVQVAQG